MPTDRPRIQAYVEPRLYELFEQWKLSQEIDKDSAALNALLAEFFKTESIDPTPAPLSLPTEDIEKIVRDEVNSLFRSQMEENADFWLNRLSERVATVEKSLEKFVNLSHCQVDELKSDLGERLAACEDSLEVLLREPATLASDSLDLTRSPEPDLYQENGQGLAQPIDSNAVESYQDDKTQESVCTSDSPSELNLSQLARHLKVSKSVVSRRKDKPDFKEWSRSKDPDGKTWSYDPGRQIFRGAAL